MNFRNPYARLIAFAAIFILVVSLLAAAAFAATPAFSVHKNGTAQTVVGNTATKLTWSTEAFDTNTNFASDRFTPTIAGTYLIVVSVQCAQPGACIPAIYKNGALYAASRITSQTFADQSPQATALVSMNGSTDYVEAFATSAGTSIAGLATQTYFSGSQIDGAGNGSAQWTDGAGGIIYYNGGNVGIGTVTPSSKLDVRDGDHANNQDIGINIGTPVAANGWLAGVRLKSNASGVPRLALDAPSGNTFATIEGLSILSTGNVGIGTTSPGTKLDVGGVGNASSLRVNRFFFYDDNSNAGLSNNSAGAFLLYNNVGTSGASTAYRFHVTSSGTAALDILNNGNVGIGTTAPAAALHVAGKIAVTGSTPAVSACGTGATIAGNDVRGIVTKGNTLVSACTITFSAAYPTAPYCAVTGSAASLDAYITSISTTALVIGYSGTASVRSFNYICLQ